MEVAMKKFSVTKHYLSLTEEEAVKLPCFPVNRRLLRNLAARVDALDRPQKAA